MRLSLETPYVLVRKQVGSTVTDNGRARFPDDTLLVEGTVFVVVKDKHPWPQHDSHALHYFIEPRICGTNIPQGGRYAVPAGNLEDAVKAFAA